MPFDPKVLPQGWRRNPEEEQKEQKHIWANVRTADAGRWPSEAYKKRVVTERPELLRLGFLFKENTNIFISSC